MTITPHTAIRIPLQLKAQLREYAKQTERTQTEIILTALRNYLTTEK